MSTGRAEAGDGLRQRLFETAEQLFAERGIDAVSLAEVARQAGSRNTGAIHYYFGGREELLAAIVAEHQGAIDTRRAALLGALESAPGQAEPVAVVGAVVAPLVDLLDGPRGQRFLAIQSQRLLRPSGDAGLPRPLVRRVAQLLGSGRTLTARDTLRWSFAQAMVFTSLHQLVAAEARDGVDLSRRRAVARELVEAAARVLVP